MDITPETQITIPCRNLLEALQQAQKLKGRLGSDYTIDSVNMTLSIKMRTVDKVLEASLTAPVTTATNSPPLNPGRVDKEVPVLHSHMRWYQRILERFGVEWASADGSKILQQAAIRRKNKAIQELRISIIRPIAEADVDGVTLVYGGSLLGAESVGSKPVECDTLIHLSHALSPEDLKERERGITAKKIIRYRILGIDEAAWDRQNQPAHWPLTPQDWVLLAQERWEQEKTWHSDPVSPDDPTVPIWEEDPWR